MRNRLTVLVCAGALIATPVAAQQIPLPEHPRPDFQRDQWLNLNGRWRFAFDASDDGERRDWANGAIPGTREILVPFSWGAPLSGVPDSANIAWYARDLRVPSSWRGRLVLVVVGACAWRATAWLDGARRSRAYHAMF